MAVVYVARAQGVAGFERLVAVKVLHANLAHEEQFISMFLDEARLAARIRHPNVVPTIDISDSPQTGYYLVMDYIEGDHLGQLLVGAHQAEERLPVSVVLRVVVDALSGLGAAHDLCDDDGKHLKLVHRDVSPHNIMVGTDGVARLTDFGVAKAEDRLTHTRDGQVKGKLAYMAPEQASTGEADPRSDLFAMGVILWECLAGRRLFRGESTAATLNKLLNEDIPLVSTIDPSLKPLDPVLQKALQRDAEQRYQSVDDFITALEEVASEFGGLASLRNIGKAVKQYAGDKLQKDRKLIKDAIHQIKHTEAAAQGRDLQELSEPSGLALDDISVSSASLSVSKLSGVFSQNQTAAGTPSALAGQEQLYDAAEVAAVASRGRAARVAVLVLGLMAVGAVAYLATAGQQGGELKVLQLAPDAPPIPEVVEPPKPEPPPPPVAVAVEPEVFELPPEPEVPKVAPKAKKKFTKKKSAAKKAVAKKVVTAPKPPANEEPPKKAAPPKKKKSDSFDDMMINNPYAH